LVYVDQNTKKGLKKRERIYKHGEYAEEEGPSNAPDWTKSGYDGPLRTLTTKALDKYLDKS
jgi:hypothetical protein